MEAAVKKRDAAGILMQAPSGRVLLVYRAAWLRDGLTWGNPGGVMDAGETEWEAALRELFEETWIELEFEEGFEIRAEEKLTSSLRSYTLFLIDVAEEFEVFVDGDETLDAIWVDPQEALSMRLHPSFRKTLKQWLDAGVLDALVSS